MDRGNARRPSDPRWQAIMEAAREEEALRYGALFLAESVINDSDKPLDPSRTVASSDPGLAAFAQLAALRLDVHTCLVSLFDGQRQHILAEAQQNTAIELGRDGQSGHSPAQSPLVLCGTAVPRQYLACEDVLDLPAVDSDEGKLLPIAVVPDLYQQPRLSSRVYLRPGSSLGRFYAGVPLRSPHGIDIGVVGIFDSKPRYLFDLSSQRFLRHVSGLVMAHLQSTVVAACHRRNERMVRGLGSMVEGLGSMSTSRHTAFEDCEDENQVLKEGALNAKQQRIQVAFPAGPPPQATRPSLSPVQPKRQDTAHLGESRPLDSTETVDSSDPDPDLVGLTSTAPKNEEDSNTVALKYLFSRAANIIRESVEVEGVLFLDASISSFGRLIPQDTEGDDSMRSRSGSSGDDSVTSEESTHRPVTCRVLGFSNSTASSIDGDASKDLQASVSDAFFERVSRRYAHGQIINFGDDGEIVWAVSDSEGSDLVAASPSSCGEDTEQILEKKLLQRPRKSDGAYLMRMFPGARSVALVPLWDAHKSRWFAGAFIWTRSRSRVFAPGELSYFKAFGATIMAEVRRAEVLRENKAKEDVLGSLSHEIRSPLHGIILGVELLHDSALTGFQNDVIHTVETCGRTLLDTLDHLLDFSKVNHFLQKPTRRKTQEKSRGLGLDALGQTIEAGMMSVFSNVRLDLLLEEVIESVYAGFSFQESSSQWANRERAHASYFEEAGTLRRLESVRRMDSAQEPATASPRKYSVGVHLDIDPAVRSWGFHAQSGALRRIIMNVFGNAMKYTSQGHIFVSLTQESFSSKKKSRRRTIILSVSDSGRGISSDYLQNRLYTPFAQENQLSTGVGLGLSLVKQIVHGLGGRIGVESVVDLGTTVRVLIPLRLSTPRSSPSIAPHHDNDFLELLKKLDGVSVSFLGISDDFGQRAPLAAETKDTRSNPKANLGRICRQFLGLQVVPEAEAVSTPPSLFICTEHAIKQIPTFQHLSVPVVVVCDSVLSAHQHQTLFYPAQSDPTIREFVSQPIGPRKLARLLVFALKRMETVQKLEHDANSLPVASPVDAREPLGTSHTIGSFFDEIPATPQGCRAIDHSSASTHKSSIPTLIATDKTSGSSCRGTNQDVPPQIDTPSFEVSVPFLLVDDNAINMKILASYMKKLKRGFDCASNGLEALLACRARTINYRCIFMDISMPVMDGLESTRLIRAHERQHELAPALIIALTGLASAKTQQEAYGSGVDLFLSKPVPLKELGNILDAKNL